MKQYKLTTEDIGRACLSMAHLVHAGVGTGDALSLLAEDQASPEEARLWARMAEQADMGFSLARIFRESGCFPDYVCALLAVGEQVGRTEEALLALARYYEGRAELNRQLHSALVYPVILLCVMLAVVAALLVWVLPVFDEVYAQLGGSLSGLAGAALALGTGLKDLLSPLFLLLATAAGALCILTFSQPAREALLRLRCRTGADRGILRALNTARFAQALSMGLSSGLTDREAVDLAATLCPDSSGFARRCGSCLTALDAGKTLPAALREQDLFSRADCRLLEAGIRSGNGEAVMQQIAQRLLRDSEFALDTLVGRIEPTLVVFLCVPVGGILLSVMLPLMHIMTAIG